jgi:hypothetical protein
LWVLHFWDQNNKGLVQVVQVLLIQGVGLLNGILEVIFHNFPAARKKQANETIKARSLFFWGRHDHLFNLFLSKKADPGVLDFLVPILIPRSSM